MTLHNHVTSLEISKTMKEMGFPQESLFYWNEFGDLVGDPFDKGWRSDQWQAKLSSAYLSSEVGEMLPGTIGIKDEVYRLTIEWTQGLWRVSYQSTGEGEFLHEEYAAREANSRASMAIYLKKQGLI